MSIFDPISRHTYWLENITSEDLERWKDGRLLQLNLFVYSSSVKTKKLLQLVEKKLLAPADKDRSGAAAEAEIAKLIETLKENHQFHFTAPYISWRRWADYLLKQPGHSRETAASHAPPHHLIHLFARAPANSDDLVADLRQNVNIGTGINNEFSTAMESLISEFAMIKTMAERLVTVTTSFERRLEAELRSVDKTRENLDLFRSAIPPAEDEFWKEMYDHIEQLEDLDHEQ